MMNVATEQHLQSPLVNTMHPLVIAVVLNWNGFEDTVKCVQSLQKVQYSNLDIIIVDNASTDGSYEKLREQFPNISLLRRSLNGGYAAGNNDGIRVALQRDAAYVLLINNDVAVENDFLLPMIECAKQDSSIGIVTCKAFLQSDPTRIYCTGGSINRWRCSGIDLPSSLQGTECDVTYISGCVLLVKREVFETVGLLDEKFFMYFEDFEFSRRAGKQFRLCYTPKGVVYHKSGAGTGWDQYTATYLYYHTRNRFWVFRHDSLFYRIYVAMFGIANALAKSVVILVKAFGKSNRTIPRKELNALWCGMRDGLRRKPS